MSTLNNAVELVEVATPAVAVSVPTEAIKAVKPSRIKSLLKAAKRSPVKSTVVVLGTASVLAGAVYAVKKVRASRAAKLEVEVSVEDTTLPNE